MNPTHILNNMLTCITLCILNFYLCYKIYSTSGNMNEAVKRKRKIVVQTFIICGMVSLAAAVCIYAQYFPIPTWLSTFSSAFYVLNGGMPALIYMWINKSLRRTAFSAVCLNRKSTVTTSVNSIVIFSLFFSTPQQNSRFLRQNRRRRKTPSYPKRSHSKEVQFTRPKSNQSIKQTSFDTFLYDLIIVEVS